MASFVEDLWNSIFTPGVTPPLLVATHATFAVLQALLFALLVATSSVHFVVLSLLSASLWYAIHWFVKEVQAEQAAQETVKRSQRGKSLDPDSETETEMAPVGPVVPVAPKPSVASKTQPLSTTTTTTTTTSSSLLRPTGESSDEALRKRRSQGDSSGYVSTDSEWEKISEGEQGGE